MEKAYRASLPPPLDYPVKPDNDRKEDVIARSHELFHDDAAVSRMEEITSLRSQ